METFLERGGISARMSESIPVTNDELRRAIGVWLKTMPRHLWRRYEAMVLIDEKRRTEADRADPREIVAEYLAERFDQADWSVSHPERGHPSMRRG